MAALAEARKLAATFIDMYIGGLGTRDQCEFLVAHLSVSVDECLRKATRITKDVLLVLHN